MVYMLKDYIISMGIYISLIAIPKSSTNYIKWYCETISWKIQDCESIKIRTHPQVIFFFLKSQIHSWVLNTTHQFIFKSQTTKNLLTWGPPSSTYLRVSYKCKRYESNQGHPYTSESSLSLDYCIGCQVTTLPKN